MNYLIQETQLFYGINRVLDIPCVRLQLKIEELSDVLLSRIDINNRLKEIGLFEKSLLPLDSSSPDSPAQLFLDLVLTLLKNIGSEGLHSKIVPNNEENIFDVFIEYEEPKSTFYAGELATDFLNALQDSPEFVTKTMLEFKQSFNDFFANSIHKRLDPNTRLLSKAAKTRGIPVIHLDHLPYKPHPERVIQNGLIQFGYGVHLHRCLGSLPESYALFNELNKIVDRNQLITLLRRSDLPVPTLDLESTNCNRLSRAQRSAEKISYPVSIKPLYRSEFLYHQKANGVFGPLWNAEQLALAYQYLTSSDIRKVSVESYAEGDCYRFLILNGEVIAVAKMIKPFIRGNGVNTVSELAQIKASLAKTFDEYIAWKQIANTDDDVITYLGIQGLNQDSIPENDRTITLRGHATPYNGGISEDITKSMPTAFKAIAERVTKVTGLTKMAGVDMVIKDITGGHLSPNCVVLDVIEEPDLVTHSKPSKGESINVQDMLLQHLYGDNNNGRIPIVAVTGTDGKTTTCRMVASIIRQQGMTVGLACSDGIYINTEVQQEGDSSGVNGAFSVLTDERTEAAVLETARGGLIKYGIAFDRCDVGTCLNVDHAHIGQDGINSIGKLADVKQQVIQRTSEFAIINADDSYSLQMIENTSAKEIVLITKNIQNTVIQKHLNDNGVVFTIKEIKGKPTIVQQSKDRENPVIAVSDIPATHNGEAEHNTSNAMFAIGIAYGLEISMHDISTALSNFNSDFNTTPGRLNEFYGFPFRVILDSANTAQGFRALCAYNRKLNIEGKKIILFGISGELVKTEMSSIIDAIANEFDLFIIKNYREAKLYGFEFDEMPKIIAAALISHGVDSKKIIEIPNIMEALDTGLKITEPEDILYVIAAPTGPEILETIDKLQVG